MDVLATCQKLMEDLRTASKDLEYIENKLSRKDYTVEELENLYEREFFLSIEVFGIYEDLEIYLKRLEKDEDMKFLAKRMKRNAEEFIRTGVMNVDDSF